MHTCHWHVVEHTGTGDVASGFCTRNHSRWSPPMGHDQGLSYWHANPDRGIVPGNDGAYYYARILFCRASCPDEWRYE